ncbi:MAG TPA: hypothetical protein VFX30_10335 [bacterium]|nr:hypothetical protein [bacterium]
MISRYLSISLLAVSSTLFGVSCNRTASGDPQPAASCEPPSGLSNPSVQWDRLIAGNPDFPLPLSEALRQGAREEAAAINPCIGVRENRAATVSMEMHYREAVLSYQEALRLLDGCGDSCGDRASTRRRVVEKISLLTISADNLSQMNRRFLLSGDAQR